LAKAVIDQVRLVEIDAADPPLLGEVHGTVGGDRSACAIAGEHQLALAAAHSDCKLVEPVSLALTSGTKMVRRYRAK
jgi:hypothetical protein